MASRLPNDAIRSLLHIAADHGVGTKPFVQALVGALAAQGTLDAAGLILFGEPGSAHLHLLAAPDCAALELWAVPIEVSRSSQSLAVLAASRVDPLSDRDPVGHALTGAGLGCALLAPLGSPWAPVGLLCAAAREGSSLRLDAELLDHAASVVGSIVAMFQAPTALAAPRSLEQLDYFATMGRLAGGLVHEVNNPAAFIALAAGQLDKSLSKASNADELQPSIGLARDIVESTRQMRAVVSDFHILSTVARHAVAGSVDLTRMMRACVTLTTVAYRTQARVQADIGDMPACPASFASLVPVVVNLLINAMQAIPAGKGASCTIQCKASGTEDRIDISVHDNGSGIEPEDLPHVFDPFFTTRGEQASGLGLTLARDTVHRLGGELQLHTTLGEGTTVEVSIPVPQEP
jgi:signal transduction histidine kinase